MNKLLLVLLLTVIIVFGVLSLKKFKNNYIRYTPEYELITIGKDTLAVFNYGTDIEIIKL